MVFKCFFSVVSVVSLSLPDCAAAVEGGGTAGGAVLGGEVVLGSEVTALSGGRGEVDGAADWSTFSMSVKHREDT